MKYTQISAILLILSLCISLAACGKTDQPNSAELTPQTAPVTYEPNPEKTPTATDTHTSAADPNETELDTATEPGRYETKPTEKPDNNPTIPSQTTPSDAPTDKPESTEPNQSNPDQPTQPPASQPDSTAEAYIAYYNMSGQEQQKFIDSFGSIEAFFRWHTAAKKAYEESRTPIDGASPILP